MKDFYETVRPLLRSTVQSNVSELDRTSDDITLVLASRSLIGRLDAINGARSIALVRAGAWSTIAVNLHTLHQNLVRQGTSYLVTKLRTALLTNVADYLEQPMMGYTLPQWLQVAQAQEFDRILRALRYGQAAKMTALEAVDAMRPFGPSNSQVSVMTITSATHIINQLAMDAARQRGTEDYTLWTDGKVIEPDIYNTKFAVGNGLLGPMFLGDRSIPILGE